MASEAAVPSAAGGKADGRRSPPATNAQSKRDRRRQNLMDRIATMNDTFQQQKDLTYRDQLQKIHSDTILVQRFDPYDTQALEKIAELQAEHKQTQGPGVHAEGARSFLDMAGIRFTDFMEEIEDLIEVRDFQLTQSKHEYDRKIQEYKNTYNYKVETAKREHRALTSTLRDRLINTLTQKKNRLTREKEVLEVNDSNALLLNPNQFSLTNPASPGGTHAKRATRLRKDADDLQQIYGGDAKRRKKNTVEDDGSPVPSRRAPDANSTTPLWQSEKARVAAKQNGPVYSIDKLFTDKELSLHYNTAALAAHQYILRQRANGNQSSPEDSDNNVDEEDSESLPSAQAMERQVSHATRSTRGATSQNFLEDRIVGFEGVANFEGANLSLIQEQEPPKMPPFVPTQYLKPYPRAAEQNYPTQLPLDETLKDIAMMNNLKSYSQSQHRAGAHLDVPAGGRKMLEQVAIPYQSGRFVAITSAAREEPDSVRDSLGLPTASGVRDVASPAPAAVLGHAATGMSRTSSLGGAAMSRSGSNRGRRGRGA